MTEWDRNLKDAGRWYVIPLGAAVRWRRRGEREWRAYATRREVQTRGYVWRDGEVFVLRWRHYEIKVRDGDFFLSVEPLPENAAAHLASI